MLHDQIAITLRDHFSTVGPSPSGMKSPLTSTIRAVPEEHVPSPSRLSLLPRNAVPIQSTGDEHVRRATGSLSSELLAAIAHRCASFFAEAAVLVLVLGILDRFLASNRWELRWIAGSFLIALGLLAASVATDVSARRWLRAP